MTSEFSHIPFFNKTVISDVKLLAAGLLYAIPLAVLLYIKPILGLFFGIMPLVILLVCHGPSSVYLLIAATFLYLPTYNNVATILPADIIAVILVISYIVDNLYRRNLPKSNRIAWSYFAYLIVIFVSIMFEGFTSASLKFTARQVLLFCTFLAIANFDSRINIKHIFLIYIVVALLNSFYSLFQFLSAGGNTRAFGLAGTGYGDHVMIGFLISAVYYLWATDIRERIFWGGSALVMIMALVATQTRASVITAGFGLCIIIYFAVKAGKHISFKIPVRSLKIAVVISFLSILLLAMYTPVFDGIIYRFGRMGFQVSGTILLRVSLWTAALKAFLANPFFGIGAGNYAQVYNWVPEVRFDPVFYMVSGLSTHSIIATALSETGIFGLFTLMFFYFKTFRVSLYNYRLSETVAQSAASVCLLTIACIIIISSIYAGSWFWGNNSYHMALFFGLIAASKIRRITFQCGESTI